MRKQTFLFFILLLIGIAGMAQTNTTKVNTSSTPVIPADNLMMIMEDDDEEINGLNFINVVAPHSPNTASLGAFGNTPVNHAIGRPDINIPIWNIKGKNIEMPISLAYNASGIRIEENGSWVGLGWTLNVGGVITQEIKGLEEEYYNLNFDVDLPIGENEIALVSDAGPVAERDPEPDVFSINCGTISGKFVFDENEIAIMTPNKNLVIEFNPKSIPSSSFSYSVFKITDSNGIVYYFEDVENTLVQPVSSVSYPYDIRNRAWLLTRIESLNCNEYIDFTYTNETTEYTQVPRKIKYARPAPSPRLIDEETYNRIIIYGKRLTQISTSYGETINFIPEQTDRIDLKTQYSSPGPKALKTIEILYNENKIKSFEFVKEFVETNYPITASDPPFYSQYYGETNFRMYLKQFIESGENNAQKPSYEFEYYGKLANGKDSLPTKLSFAQDFWGFYNGQRSNTELCPTYSGQYVYSGNVIDWTKNGADRLPSFPEMRHGTIKSIKYPTGGSTNFFYENHTYKYEESIGLGEERDAGGLRIKKLEDISSNNTVKVKEYEYDSGTLIGSLDCTIEVYYNNGNVSERTPPEMNPPFDSNHFIRISSGTPIEGQTNGSHIGYRNVIEREAGNGYTEYQFTSGIEFPDKYDLGDGWSQLYLWKNFSNINSLPYQSSFGWSTDSRLSYPVVPKSDMSWKRGLLLQKHIFDEAGDRIYFISNNYDYSNEIKVPGIVVNVTNFITSVNNSETIYEWGNYNQSLGTALLTGESEYIDNVTTNTSYSYDNSLQLSVKTINYLSNGATLKTEYNYPYEYDTTQNFLTLINKNIIAKPIDTRTYSNDQLISGTQTEYNDDGQPIKIRVAEIDTTDIPFYAGTPYTFTEKATYDYNTQKTIKQVSPTENISTAYLWDATGMYVMAKVENATHSQIITQEGKACTYSSLTLYNSLKSLVPGAIITTFTHKPLVGITSQTDPAGRTIYYEYDDFGRLKLVQDQNGNIVAKNEYHYAGQ